MAIATGIAHAYENTISDDPGARVGAARWNAAHVVSDDTITKAMLNDDAALFLVPAGGIIIWSGAANAIPGGWLICDGTNGTPNLHDRFVIGTKVAGTNAVGATGGSATQEQHTLTPEAADGVHGHAITAQAIGATATATTSRGDSGNQLDVARQSHTHSLTGVTASDDGSHQHAAGVISASSATANMPPWYALCYIQKS